MSTLQTNEIRSPQNTDHMQTAKCRLQIMQTVGTEDFFLILVFAFTFDSHFFGSRDKLVFSNISECSLFAKTTIALFPFLLPCRKCMKMFEQLYGAFHEHLSPNLSGFLKRHFLLYRTGS